MKYSCTFVTSQRVIAWILSHTLLKLGLTKTSKGWTALLFLEVGSDMTVCGEFSNDTKLLIAELRSVESIRRQRCFKYMHSGQLALQCTRIRI